MSDYIWTTQDDKEIHITDMETSHLVNTIRFIEKKDFQAVEVFGSSWGGEVSYDEEYHDWRPIYENIKIELRLRKLEGRCNE